MICTLFKCQTLPFDPSVGLCQSGPESDGNEEVLCIPQSSSITKTSASDCFASYPGYYLRWRSYSYAEIQLMYTTALSDRVVKKMEIFSLVISRYFHVILVIISEKV